MITLDLIEDTFLLIGESVKDDAEGISHFFFLHGQEKSRSGLMG